jgi:hypothetical protein
LALTIYISCVFLDIGGLFHPGDPAYRCRDFVVRPVYIQEIHSDVTDVLRDRALGGTMPGGDLLAERAFFCRCHWHPGFIRKHRTAKIAEGFEQKATNLPCKCCKGMLEFIEKKKRKLIM